MNRVATTGFLAMALTAILGTGMFAQVYAQSMPSIPGLPNFATVSGEYANEEFGVSIVFPDGWEGMELPTEEGVIVNVSPDMASASAGEFPTAMMLTVALKGDEAEEPPTDPSTQEGDMPCEAISTEITQAAGVEAIASTAECNIDGVTATAKTIVVDTESRWVIVSMMGTTANFNANVATFDSSVQTLNVDGAVNIEGIEEVIEETVEETTEEVEETVEETVDVVPVSEVSLVPETVSLTVGGEAVDLEFSSSSIVTAMQIDEESKTLSFTVDGENGTAGVTEIAIGTVLEGPYTVMIDGEVAENVEEFTDEVTGEAMLRVSYTHSTHEVTVAGTNVVPEFGAIAALILAGSIVAVVAVARSRGFGPTLPKF